MKLTYDTYNKRIEEIDLYYNALRHLDEELTQLSGNSVEPIEKRKRDDFLKILKANALLMIYNLVESTMLNAIQEIYDKLKASGATYTTVRKEIQTIWFSYKFKQVYHQPEAHFYSYMDKALEIVNSIMAHEIIVLDKNGLSYKGNLNADEIRNVCKSHGIRFKLDPKCKGGVRLNDVEEKRNQLAHGMFSFAEIGGDYTVIDLIEIKEQAYAFLTGLLDGMKQYYDDEGYLGT
jgi:hypothetical protein